MRIVSAVLMLALALMSCARSTGDRDTETDEIMALIQTWFGGVYDNSAQVAADAAQNLPADKRQMPLHQVVAPVTIEGFAGLT